VWAGDKEFAAGSGESVLQWRSAAVLQAPGTMIRLDNTSSSHLTGYLNRDYHGWTMTVCNTTRIVQMNILSFEHTIAQSIRSTVIFARRRKEAGE
jgi:hypothetical protein